jgi:hypothetical protein
LTNRKVSWHSGNHNSQAGNLSAVALEMKEEMARDVISTCPVCSSELSVTRLQCRGCGTAIEGDFSVGRFARLSRDQMALLEGFLRARGNLKELERELKVSYPTVRARIDSLFRALGVAEGGYASEDGTEEGSAARAETGEQRREVLERLARHEITADEAATLIRSRKE